MFPGIGVVRASLIICAAALAFALFKIGCGMRIVTVVQGGIRETWGIFFFSFGVIFRALEPRMPRLSWWHAVAIFAFLIAGGMAGMDRDDADTCAAYRSNSAGDGNTRIHAPAPDCTACRPARQCAASHACHRRRDDNVCLCSIYRRSSS